jgi:hypothetical protein
MMPIDKRKNIFEILRDRGLFSASTQKIVGGFMERWGVDVFRAVIETHLIEEPKIADILSEEFNIPRLKRVRNLYVEKSIFEFICYEAALEHTVFPFELKTDGTLKVAVADPSPPQKLSQISSLAEKPIEPYVTERSEIISSIQRHYPLSKQLPSLLSNLRVDGVGKS